MTPQTTIKPSSIGNLIEELEGDIYNLELQLDACMPTGCKLFYREDHDLFKYRCIYEVHNPANPGVVEYTARMDINITDADMMYINDVRKLHILETKVKSIRLLKTILITKGLEAIIKTNAEKHSSTRK